MLGDTKTKNLMRLWTLHPRYLDPQGLVALWREALLAKAVIGGKTRGYRHHPQLNRFQIHRLPRTAISAYLHHVHQEAASRGYNFDRDKVGPVRGEITLPSTIGQMQYEWDHLLRKLRARNPALHRQWRKLEAPESHPVFRLSAGGIEPWERP
jgi:hypothetical protein